MAGLRWPTEFSIKASTIIKYNVSVLDLKGHLRKTEDTNNRNKIAQYTIWQRVSRSVPLEEADEGMGNSKTNVSYLTFYIEHFVGKENKLIILTKPVVRQKM